VKTVRGIRGVSPERYSVTRRVHWSRASASRLDWIQRNWDGWCSVGLCTVNKPSPVPDRQNCIQQTVVSMVKDKNDGLYRTGDRIVSCDRSFAVAEPYVWNRISATLRQITSYGSLGDICKHTYLRPINRNALRLSILLRYTDTLT